MSDETPIQLPVSEQHKRALKIIDERTSKSPIAGGFSRFKKELAERVPGIQLDREVVIAEAIQGAKSSGSISQAEVESLGAASLPSDDSMERAFPGYLEAKSRFEQSGGDFGL